MGRCRRLTSTEGSCAAGRSSALSDIAAPCPDAQRLSFARPMTPSPRMTGHFPI
eukprot:gene38374-50375_t